MISHREFMVIGFECNEPSQFSITLDELFNTKSDVESIHALRWDIDNILTLSLGKTLYVRLSRDCDHAIGVIKRIK